MRQQIAAMMNAKLTESVDTVVIDTQCAIACRVAPSFIRVGLSAATAPRGVAPLLSVLCGVSSPRWTVPLASYGAAARDVNIHRRAQLGKTPRFAVSCAPCVSRLFQRSCLPSSSGLSSHLLPSCPPPAHLLPSPSYRLSRRTLSLAAGQIELFARRASRQRNPTARAYEQVKGGSREAALQELRMIVGHAMEREFADVFGARAPPAHGRAVPPLDTPTIRHRHMRPACRHRRSVCTDL